MLTEVWLQSSVSNPIKRRLNDDNPTQLHVRYQVISVRLLHQKMLLFTILHSKTPLASSPIQQQKVELFMKKIV